MIIYIPSAEVPRVWEMVQGYLGKAVEYVNGEMALEDFRQDLISGRKQLWVIAENYKPKGACITEIADYPRKRIIRVLLLGGEDIKSWIGELLETGEAWARRIGAKSIEIDGRKGWVRFLKDFRLTHYRLSKEI